MSAFTLYELHVRIHVELTQWRPVLQVRQLTRSEEYKKGSWPISTPLFDNINYGQRFAVKILKTPASVCQTHLTGIVAANNSTQRKHFKERQHYEDFFDYVCSIMRFSLEHAGIHLQGLLVHWLRSTGEDNAANRFEKYWCGPIKGRWLLGNIGIGGVTNQQGIEVSLVWSIEASFHSIRPF